LRPDPTINDGSRRFLAAADTLDRSQFARTLRPSSRQDLRAGIVAGPQSTALFQTLPDPRSRFFSGRYSDITSAIFTLLVSE
jgi:hypothetical protein